MGKILHPISIFILDVSNSSSEDIGEDLTDYLDEVVNWIIRWTEGIGSIQVKHRSGDEIIFVGPGYSTAYIIAFYISRVWKYHNHRPYFGLAFGDIDKELSEVDIEKWIHPLIKQARYANDLLKADMKRPPFRFELDQFYSGGASLIYNEFRSEFEILINALLQVQHIFIREQTNIQDQVCSAYLILQKQKAVGELLGKTAPTISSHFKKGKSEEIIQTFQEISNTLNALQRKSYPEQDDPKKVTQQLLDSVNSQLKEAIHTLLDNRPN